MILDAQNKLAASQALTTTGAVGSNVIDLGADRSIGNGEPMCVLFNVEVAADQTTGDEDYTFDVETSSDAAQTTAVRLLGRRKFESGTPDAPYEDADLLVAGFQFMIPVPATLLSESERYLGIRSVLAGTTPTITISAYLVPMNMAQLGANVYPNNYTITG
jgi:hypothetical protein